MSSTSHRQELPSRRRCRRSVRQGAHMHRLVLITLLIGVAATVAAATASSERTAPAKLRNGKISFWSDRAFDGRAQVFVMNADGSDQRRLTELFSAKRGDFSADGQKLAFDGRGRETLDDFDIFVMNADGSDVRQLTRGPDRDTQASWSPDGRLVAFGRERSENSIPSLWIVRADGSDAHRITEGIHAAWSPDGSRIAVGGRSLRIMRPDGTQARK